MPSYKVIQSGHIVEIYKYQCGMSKRYDEEFECRGGGRDNEGIEERKKEYKGTVSQRARNQIRRLINANFDKDSLFITLTYEENFQDVKLSNKNFKEFVQRMKRRQPNFKYIAVLEFQKRGALHYHMLCNYELEWKKGRKNLKERQSHERELGKIWRHGFADIGYKENDNAGAYLIKYMTKDNKDIRLEGKQTYLFSRNCVQPKELTGGDAIAIIKEFENMPPAFTNSYYSEFHGKVEYFEYNPLRYDYNAYKDSIEVLEENCINKAIELFGDLVEVF